MTKMVIPLGKTNGMESNTVFGWGERREEGTVIGETILLIMFGWVDGREEGIVREETFPLSHFFA